MIKTIQDTLDTRADQKLRAEIAQAFQTVEAYIGAARMNKVPLESRSRGENVHISLQFNTLLSTMKVQLFKIRHVNIRNLETEAFMKKVEKQDDL